MSSLTTKTLREAYGDFMTCYGAGFTTTLNEYEPIVISSHPTMLKKLTNMISGMKQPLRNYLRLGWVEVIDDEYTVTHQGVAALAEVALGLTKEKTIEKYAANTVKRLEKEEKE